MKTKFDVGQRVSCGSNESVGLTKKINYGGEYGDELVFGKVTEVLPNGLVKVMWDENWLNELFVNGITHEYWPVKVKSDWLLTEAEGKAKFSALEKEFDAIADQVIDKLKEAGKLIKEANKIAKKSGAKSLYEMYDAHDPLLNAMDAAGWRTSSFNC